MFFLLENDNQPKAILSSVAQCLFSFSDTSPMYSLKLVSHPFLFTLQIADAVATAGTTSSSLSSSVTSSRSSTPKVMNVSSNCPFQKGRELRAVRSRLMLDALC